MTIMFDYDAELRLHYEHFRAATSISRGDRVLDVGCGAGLTTRDAARAAANGEVLGIDVSERMLDRARQVTADEGLSNITYMQADASTHAFPREHYDVCISRFGTMFFDDPLVAFTNIGRALRPAARLTLLVWQGRENNAWAGAIHQAATGAATPADDGSAFSLGHPDTTTGILTAAGFTDISFTDVDEPVYYGPDVDNAYTNVLELHAPEDAAGERRLRTILAEHDTGDGVYFPSRAWVVTAQRAG